MGPEGWVCQRSEEIMAGDSAGWEDFVRSVADESGGDLMVFEDQKGQGYAFLQMDKIRAIALTRI